MNPNTTLPLFKELYAEHWKYVVRVLPNYGIHNNDRSDLAQKVWTTVYLSRDNYNPEEHKTPKAWVTGIARRLAANHHRTQTVRMEVPTFDVGETTAAPMLNPEEMALLRTVTQAIRDEDRREAFLLQRRNGLSIAEIAAVQEVSEDTVKWRLRMANKDLNAEDDDKKVGAFLGFGSLDALTEALQPGPIADEVGEHLWKQIEEKIREIEADPNSPAASIPDPSAPTRSSVSGQVTRGTLAALIGGSLAVGAIIFVLWRVIQVERNLRSVAVEIRAADTLPTATESSLPAVVDTSRKPTIEKKLAIPKSTAKVGAADESEDIASRSGWMLAAMRRAYVAGHFSDILMLATEHKRRFRDGEGAVERERLRILALRHLHRTNEAERLASAAVQKHPTHRAVFDRAKKQSVR